MVTSVYCPGSEVMKMQLAHWKGSEQTKEIVREQILSRFGEQAASEYDPMKNCFTFMTWKKLGYQVKKGEKALVSITYIVKKNKDGDEDEEVKYRKNVFLFFKCQVEKI